MPERANAASDGKFHPRELKALEKALRRIVRAHDLHSKALAKSTGLTAAQLIILRGIAELGQVTSTAISAYADISLATVVMVLDNLEERGIIQRYRSDEDRRVVHTRLTALGAEMVAKAPPPFGQNFASRFAAMDETRRREIVVSLSAFADLLTPVFVAGPPMPEETVSRATKPRG